MAAVIGASARAIGGSLRLFITDLRRGSYLRPAFCELGASSEPTAKDSGAQDANHHRLGAGATAAGSPLSEAMAGEPTPSPFVCAQPVAQRWRRGGKAVSRSLRQASRSDWII